jgi:iron complex outermembrane receptor protein
MLSATIAVAACGYARAEGESQPDLAKLSIEELGQIKVTSVSKRPEAVAEAASSIYVITHDEIERSGANTIPEMLRLAPNLLVEQKSASGYVITARGFNGQPANENFSNKLLVLIDGRSVYTPIFSGVFWDMQAVLPADVERIEVISGPGATLWGANAVNGVINIITRKAADAEGGLVQVAGGNWERTASLRFGGKLGDSVAYRVYATNLFDEASRLADGSSAQDQWGRAQAGFRLDWTATPADTVTVQGDGYGGSEAQPGARAERLSGGNLTGRWDHVLSNGSALQVQAYYDRARRGQEVSGAGLVVNTYDIDAQYSFDLGPRQALVAGGGARAYQYRIDGSSSLFFAPAARTLRRANLFVQDTVALDSSLKQMLGAKLEDDAYVGAQLLPNVRLAWSPNPASTVWGSISRAVRSPTPFDRDVVEFLGATKFLVGGANFQPENVTAYEAGVRVQPFARASLSVSTYYNDYDALRSIEITPVTVLPLRWGNGMAGHAYGIEAWGDYQLTDWWRVSGSVNALSERFKFKPGSSGLGGLMQVADDPKFQAQVKSSMDLGSRLTLDGALRYVSVLPNPRVPSYVELNGRLGWRLTDRYELSLDARNLLHDRHLEYAQGTEIPRSVFVDLQVRF